MFKNKGCNWISKLFILSILIETVFSKISDQRIQHSENLIETDFSSLYTESKNSSFYSWLTGITKRPKPKPTPPGSMSFSKSCSLNCTCGVANKQRRIVGGQETEVNQYPWMAMLRYAGRFYCGASLINDKYVLTAAHCVNGFDAGNIGIRFLEHDRRTGSGYSIDRKALKIIRHGAYSSATYNNDIALIRLNQPLELRKPISPVCLPTAGKSYTGQRGIVTGWGATTAGGATSDTLQEVEVPIMSNSQCRQTAYGPSRITDNMLCAGYDFGQKDSCQGDSGGPLHIIDRIFHQVVGVVSWGEGCARPQHPGVYTRVNRYRTWIRANTPDACYC